MKKLLELLVCIAHPLAVILVWLNLLKRSDIAPAAKTAWALFALVPAVPFLYVLTSGDLW